MQAASPFEEHLLRAYERGDLALCLRLLRDGDLACPISDAAAGGAEPIAWPTVTDGVRTWLIGYTSAEAMRAGTGDAVRHHRIVSMTELAAGWPDLRWGLAINPGLEPSFLLESGTVARLAVPTLEQDVAAEPGAGIPVVQKLLRPRDIQALLDSREPRVSGYCHHAMDVEHIATPVVLARALLQEEALTSGGAVNILRWPVVGPALYRTPYGGVDEEGMAAVAGWVVEEPPFVGMGLAPNVDETIREYKVNGVGLPNGAEIVELGADGRERVRARYDGDRRWWVLIEGA